MQDSEISGASCSPLVLCTQRAKLYHTVLKGIFRKQDTRIVTKCFFAWKVSKLLKIPNDKDEAVNKSESKDSQETLRNSEQFGKFFKMLQMNIPRAAVENKMRMLGHEAQELNVLNFDPEMHLTDAMKKLNEKEILPKENLNNESNFDLPESLIKFDKMVKMKIPLQAVQNKMVMEGISSEHIDIFNKLHGVDSKPAIRSSIPPSNPKETGAKDLGETLEKCEKYSKFFKMLRMKLPKGAVENAMRKEGFTSFEVLDKDPTSFLSEFEESSSKESKEKIEKKTSEKKERVKYKDHEKFAKFFKMQKMNIPRGAIEKKMTMEGLTDMTILDKDPESFVVELETKMIKLKEHEKYKKFLKMVQMNIPKTVVENKMRMVGLTEVEIGYLDKDGDFLVPENAATGSSLKLEMPIAGKNNLGTAPSTPKSREYTVKSTPKPRESVMRRKVHWKTISSAKVEEKSPKKTVWNKMKKFDFEEVDKDEIQRLFTCKVDPSAINTPKRFSAAKKQNPSAAILDMQRSNNIAIVLSRLTNLGEVGKTIQRSLITLDIPDQISEEEFLTILNLTPTDQEEKNLSNFKGSRVALGKPEKYFFALLDVKRYKQKINCFKFKLKMESKADNLVEEMSLVLKACTHLVESEKFSKILNLLLALGNLINGTTEKRNRVTAFGIESLSRLSNTKSFVGKVTALSFVAKLFSEKHRELLGYINSNFEMFKQVSMIPFSFLLGEVRQMETHFKAVELEHKKLNAAVIEKRRKEQEIASAEKPPTSTQSVHSATSNTLTLASTKGSEGLPLSTKSEFLQPQSSLPKIETEQKEKPLANESPAPKGFLADINSLNRKSTPGRNTSSLSVNRKTTNADNVYSELTKEDLLFHDALKKLMDESKQRLDVLLPLAKETSSAFKSTLEFLCEEESSTCESLFGQIYVFMKEVQKSVKESEQQKAREVKRLRDKNAKDAKELEKKTQRRPKLTRRRGTRRLSLPNPNANPQDLKQSQQTEHKE